MIIIALVGSNIGTFFFSYSSIKEQENQKGSQLINSPIHNNSIAYKNPPILNNFTKINKYGYDSSSMNCTTKSILFAQYLYSIGEHPKIITIGSTTQRYGHMAVIWNERIFDPTFTPAFYNEPKSLYLAGIKDMGFDGIVIISDYSPQKFDNLLNNH